MRELYHSTSGSFLKKSKEIINTPAKLKRFLCSRRGWFGVRNSRIIKSTTSNRNEFEIQVFVLICNILSQKQKARCFIYEIQSGL